MKTTRKAGRRRAVRRLPTTMRAAAIDRFGPPSVLKVHELPVPRVGPRDVLIAVDTAAVGTWEPHQRSAEWATDGGALSAGVGLRRG